MYIKPNKFLDMNSCILKISSEILKQLLKNKRVSYSKLYKEFEEEFKEETDYIFLPALNFLFLIGKIEYLKKNDEVRLIK